MISFRILRNRRQRQRPSSSGLTSAASIRHRCTTMSHTRTRSKNKSLCQKLSALNYQKRSTRRSRQKKRASRGSSLHRSVKRQRKTSILARVTQSQTCGQGQARLLSSKSICRKRSRRTSLIQAVMANRYSSNAKIPLRPLSVTSIR